MSDDPTKMRRVWHGAEIDLSTWTWGEKYDEGITSLMMKGAAVRISEVLREVFKDDPPTLDLPIGWSPKGDGLRDGKAVEDPVTLYVGLSLGPDEDEHVHYALSLEGCIDDIIELHEPTNNPGKVEDNEGRTICASIAARLRQLADKLDAACAEDTPL